MNELLEIIEKRIQLFSATLTANPVELYDPIKYTLEAPAKRVRPLLTILGAALYNADISSTVDTAVAVELFHNFSLIHDDIMDQAPLRRGRPTVHQKWNSSTAILSGDALLVKAYELISHSSISAEAKIQVIKVFNKVALLVCEGQQMDMNFETQNNIKINDYLKMIELKTAVLLGGALQMGAITAGASKDEGEQLFEIGRNLGLAFQLQDDLLDIYGASKIGKQMGGDIISNKKTYLLLKAIELTASDNQMHHKLMHFLTDTNIQPDDKVKEVKAIYDLLTIKQFTQSEIQHYYQHGLSQLSSLKANEANKQKLTNLIQGLIAREL